MKTQVCLYQNILIIGLLLVGLNVKAQRQLNRGYTTCDSTITRIARRKSSIYFMGDKRISGRQVVDCLNKFNVSRYEFIQYNKSRKVGLTLYCTTAAAYLTGEILYSQHCLPKSVSPVVPLGFLGGITVSLVFGFKAQNHLKNSILFYNQQVCKH